MSYFGIPLRNGVGLGLGATTGLRNAAINAGASLSLNFQSATLDSRITFSRTSNATLTGSDGLIQYAPHNLQTYSEQFDNAVWTKSALTVSANSTIAPDGTLTADSIIESATTAYHNFYNLPSFIAGQVITGSLYLKANTRTFALVTLSGQAFGGASASNGAIINLSTGAIGSTFGTYSNLTVTNAGNGWYRVSITTTTSASNTGSLQVILATADSPVFANLSYAGNGTSGIYIWGAQLNAGSLQPYYPTTTTAYYGPRFDYDPITLACKGLLIEEQRVNLLTYSEQFDNAAWTAIAASVTANSAVSPNGTATGDSLIPNTTSATHYVYETISMTSGVSYTMAVYAKPAGYNRFMFRESTTAGYFVVFDVAAGTVINTSGATGTINAVGNGWYRCSMTITAPATASTIMSIIGMNNAGTTYANATFAGNGTSGIYIWGAQLEAGAFATSYIPTVASQVTRTADNASMTGTNFSSWYNASEGTLNSNFAAVGRVASTRPVAQICDGSSNNNIQNYVFDTINGTSARTNAVTQADIGLGSYTENTNYKVASGFALNNVNGSANGSIGTTDTSVTLPSTLDRLYIGCGAANSVINTNTAGHLNGTIKSISYYPRRLTNQELIAITA